MRTYDTMVEGINDLKARGYTLDFELAFDKLTCVHRENNIDLVPCDFEIVEVYRFEGESNPGDSSILFAIESNDGKIKGQLTSAYGMYSNAMSDELIQKLRYDPRKHN